MLQNYDVAIAHKAKCSYPPKKYLFRPGKNYPEYLYKNDISPSPNDAYELVRNSLHFMGFDNVNFGKNSWNPLGHIIHPGDKILIKPNLVLEENRSGGGTDCLYTQPSVVAAVIDYVLIALNGKGEIVIGDAPVQECNFEKLIEDSGYGDLIRYYKNKNIKIKLSDFRELKTIVKNGIRYQNLESNCDGTVIDLKEQSEFSSYDQKHLDQLRITNYDPNLLKAHHCAGKHEYYVSNYVLKADVIINMPKPKTHRKAGVTIALKNLVGVNVRKEFLPHHTMGAKLCGGDEYLKTNLFKSVKSFLIDWRNHYSAENKFLLYRVLGYCCVPFRVLSSFSKDKFTEGSWYGNETICKTIADLNKIVFYADANGNMQDKPQRKMLIVADMIISGEKEGPLLPSPKQVGIVAVGENPMCFDEAIATIMGAEIAKIPTFSTIRNIKKYALSMPIQHARIVSNMDCWNNMTVDTLPAEAILNFVPSSGWSGVFKTSSM